MNINQSIEDQLKVVQLKFNGLDSLTNSEATFSANPPIQFTSPKPKPKNNLEIEQEKREALENKILQYILDKYDSILSTKQRKLLPNYIEAYLLNLPFQSEYCIHQFIHEAGANIIMKPTCVYTK